MCLVVLSVLKCVVVVVVVLYLWCDIVIGDRVRSVGVIIVVC